MKHPIRSVLARFRRGGPEPALTNPPTRSLDVNWLIETLNLVSHPTAVAEHPGWRRPHRVLVNAASDPLLDWLSPAAPSVELLAVRGAADGLMKIVDADVMIGYLTPPMLAAAKELRWIQLHVAGIDGVLRQGALAGREILVTNVKGAATAVIAEHAFALLLALTRRLEHLARYRARRHWAQFDLEAGAYGHLWGRQLLIAGFGSIGSACARLGRAFGMRVSAIRNRQSSDLPPEVDAIGSAGDLPSMLSQADVIINTLPLTMRTQGLFNRSLFARMKEHALFVNVGRGGTVVTDDLVEALRAGQIAGAGLDVVDPEPLPRNHPLWAAKEAVITPHVASHHDGVHDIAWTLMRENLRRYVAGERMLSVVDVERGY